MKTKYSKSVREEAALICAVAASNPDLWSYPTAISSLGLPYFSPAHELAVAAWRSLVHYDASSPQRDAEAEALIRTGWSP